MEYAGWVGGLVLAVCAIPQAFLSFKQKHSDGISHSMIVMWGIGEVLVLMYVIPRQDWPLIWNYGTNAIVVAIIAYYKYFPTRT